MKEDQEFVVCSICKEKIGSKLQDKLGDLSYRFDSKGNPVCYECWQKKCDMDEQE